MLQNSFLLDQKMSYLLSLVAAKHSNSMMSMKIQETLTKVA